MRTTVLILAFFLTIFGSAFGKPIPTTNFHGSKIVSKVADAFGTFHVHRQGDFASLNWNMINDAATSFVIERSYFADDPYGFERIADVTANPGRWNRYIDNTVEPGVIYYRITALDANGNVIDVTDVESVKIVKHK